VAYAIIQAGGKQFRVTEGQVIRVPSLTAKVGSSVEFDVLVSSNGDRIDVGAPTVDGSRVTGVDVEHGRGPKIIVFKKKRRKQYKKTHGHRQDFTAVRIESLGGESKRGEAEKVEARPAQREATQATEAAETAPAPAGESTEAAGETNE
jgi:large subunit ribosomal protein L21